MPNDNTPTAQQIADAVKARKGLETKKGNLEQRVGHLNKSIESLADDADAADAQWFADELRTTEVNLKSVETKLTNIEALVAANAIREEESTREDLVSIYKNAQASGTVYQLPDSLRKRALEAYQAEAERALLATD